MVRRRLAALASLALTALTAAAPWAAAHPHGTLDCSLKVVVRQDRLAWVEQRLAIDAASSAALVGRLRLDSAEPGREALAFRSLLAGLFRHSGWMLQLRAGPQAQVIALEDPEPPAFTLTTDGRVGLTVRLQPADAAAALPVQTLALGCQDTSWYWLPRFRTVADVTVDGVACRVALDGWQRVADQAQAQQSAAQQSGVAGADRMAPGLADDRSSVASLARLQC